MIKELNSKQIIRNFNLYLLFDIELEEPYISIYNDLENCFKNLNIYCSSRIHLSSYTYYGKSKDDLYIKYDNKSEYVTLSYYNIYEAFEIKHGLTMEVIKKMSMWCILNMTRSQEIPESPFIHFETKLSESWDDLEEKIK